ncbi:MAG: DUF192 domain-containing protein [Novosphingobium sp.]|nr:MAG: DUF192 domain-containing protein [Novosphingobium sp.]
MPSWGTRGLIAVGLMLAACSTQPNDTAAKTPPQATVARHAESGLPVVPLTVTHDRRRHAFRVELARTSAEQAKGLMFRTQMGANEGMIFPMDPPRLASFWMRNTVIPLDIIFVGEDRRVLNIAANAVPYAETPIPSAGKVSAVLELIGGRAAALGIVAGDKVDW